MYDEEEAPKKSKLGCFIKIPILLVVLAVLGYFGWWYYQKWQDDGAWEKALKTNSVAGYEKYMRDQPEGSYVPAASNVIGRIKQRMAELEKKKAAEAKKPKEPEKKKSSAAVQNVRDNLAWNKAITKIPSPGMRNIWRVSRTADSSNRPKR